MLLHSLKLATPVLKRKQLRAARIARLGFFCRDAGHIEAAISRLAAESAAAGASTSAEGNQGRQHHESHRQDAEDAAVREKQKAAERFKKMTRKQIGADMREKTKTEQEKKVMQEVELLTKDRDRKYKAEKRVLKRRSSRKSSTDPSPG
ncbi:hypothetical protein PHYSODRAFT_305890 [Phytophthora sojae]|uniref:Uncharacterized protein n=1 Tax=Phytophthora sojae (strain P6497) TaxID=1094619 RepID=G5A740_PHYSP|nr:hypothetical protein PHYSODRAFT_305890 [Phytophthora sojae]EGZ09145.1 hypothetical protein PHYSODRAFT_305890 [Phytophthora sojae]|eukprot:XP_009535778.1 hypothetical protein PHYSODRAFT_305890 [Phytophthora sojae]